MSVNEKFYGIEAGKHVKAYNNGYASDYITGKVVDTNLNGQPCCVIAMDSVDPVMVYTSKNGEPTKPHAVVPKAYVFGELEKTTAINGVTIKEI